MRGGAVLAAQVQEDGRAAERVGQSTSLAFPDSDTPPQRGLGPMWLQPQVHSRHSHSSRGRMGPKALGKSVSSVCQSARTERETLQGEWELADGVRRNSPDKEQREWKHWGKKERGKFGERRV